MDDNLRNQLEKETKTDDSNSSTEQQIQSAIATRPADSKKWLVANQQKLPNLNTFSSCICLADLNGDNDYKLIIGDYGDNNNIRLLIFKGINIQAQIKLNDYPVAVTSFYMDQNDMNVPSISVAAGSNIYIYKNLKPFYKFTLPLCQVNTTEQETWDSMYDKLIDTISFRTKLVELRKLFGESSLTPKTQAFLDLDEKNLEELDQFLEEYKNEPLKRYNIITCMNTIKKSTAEEKAICYLIIGTENCDLFIIEPSAFTVVASFKLPSVAVFIEVSGSFDDSEYRIMVSCRDAHIYTIKRNLTKPRLSVQLISQCCSMIKMNSNIVIACIDNNLNCFSPKGQSLWTIKQPASIKAMTSINIEMFGLRMIAVALANKEIIFYNEKNVYDVLLFDEVICSMKFGRFNREDALILISETGQLTIMILKRTAKFYNLEQGNKNILNDLASNTTKLNIPKKTKFFVDQTMRERENSIGIHRTFQQDLYRLKLITSRAYVKAITHGLNPISSNNSHPIKLSVSIHGLGPIFKLVLELQNISVDQPSMNLFLTFKCNPKIYQITPNFIFIPFISPGNNYSFNNKIELINDLGLSESIRIYVCKKNEKVPIITAIVNVPKCEVI